VRYTDGHARGSLTTPQLWQGWDGKWVVEEREEANPVKANVANAQLP